MDCDVGRHVRLRGHPANANFPVLPALPQRRRDRDIAGGAACGLAGTPVEPDRTIAISPGIKAFIIVANHLEIVGWLPRSVLMNHQENPGTTRGSRDASNNFAAGSAATLYEAGLEHMLAGRLLDAQRCCGEALALDANDADALHLMGLLCFQAEQYDHAVEWMARAIRQNPKPDYLSNLGTTLTRQGRHEEALKTFDKALQLQPGDAALWVKLGNALAELKRPTDALLSFQQALKLDRRHWEAAYQCGVLFHEGERFEEALAHFNLCNELRPDHVATLQGRARSLRRLKRFEECLADVMRAHAIDPADPVTCNNVANALRGLGKLEEGLQWFDKALALQPNSLPILFNKAFAVTDVHRFEEAFEIYGRIEALDPDNAGSAFHRSHLQLLNGDFETGWSAREARWRVSGLPIIYPNFSQPVWLGSEDIEGKTLLIYSDEGLGDAIQFARYVPMAAARGARVVLVVPDALYPLLSGLPGIQECRRHSSGFPTAFDAYCPLLSLPLAFDTRLETIPPAAYLPPLAPDRVRAWEDRLGLHDRLRVGLVWSGNPRHPNDHDRSMTLRSMARLFDVGATFVSLQKDPRPDDKAALAQRKEIVDLTADLGDLAETAALISCLDLVITVDTSVAHLAATLGCPTWLLLPYLPDWRWLLGRDTSPWYPSMQLFRQTKRRDYGEVLDQVRNELLTLIAR
jgi:tetratricopeptide (TPR) repeat protein